MSTTSFLLALWALLLTPGPTNTLLALAGAERGPARALRLLPAELCGYLAVVVPLAAVGPRAMAHWPGLGVVVPLIAAAWVLGLAVRLWSPPAAMQAQGSVSAPRVLVTTLLNPKALIVGLVLLTPVQAAAFRPRLALFALSVAMVATLWAGSGALLAARARGAAAKSGWLRRAAAVWLAMLSAALAVKGLAA